MRVIDILDPAHIQEVVATHASSLGISGVGSVELLDGRISHPHNPESPRCRGWAHYELRAMSGTTAQLYLKAFPTRSSAEEFLRLPAGRSRDAVHLRQAGMIAWLFPRDPGMLSLQVLCDRGRVAPYLPPEGPLSPQLPVRLRVVRYQPETSAVVEYRHDGASADGGAAVYGKAYSALGSRKLLDRQKLLRRHGVRWPVLRVAEPLGCDESLNVVWTRGVAGLPLLQLLPSVEAREAGEAVAETVGALHSSGIPVSDRLTRQDCVAEARKKLAKLQVAYPAGGMRLAALCAPHLVDGHVGSRNVTCHGDLHAQQILMSPEGPVLLDLDSMVAAEPELDLAEMVVDLTMRNLPRKSVTDFVSSVLAAYASAVMPIDVHALRLYANAEFVNRCYRRLRRPTPGWDEALETDLDRHRLLMETLRSE